MTKASESRVQSELRLYAAKTNNKLFRNNSGALPDQTGRIIRYGLGNDSKALNETYKSSDLIGLTRVLIEPHHVGRIFGVFTASEVKGSDFKGVPRNDRERAQYNFIQDIIRHGGIAGFCSSVEDYSRLIEEYIGKT